ncbi:MAG TPA: hypothetical protein PKO41_02545 [Dokdonella sp.]|uniref:hypothetical protein n=1 Tax=Dokdonella sp. TaxID=2291710 RepID=UPI0025C2ED9B|nr:hypothetical protein [Dokdonella sp.]MBX3690826.1 hypothetical protein [Dokdonella sp.]MCW5568931.1 hypothetical protein [Dokdonella sp.]HNR91282.1 hypothetical protein [Dokdonella sp.]
MNAPTPAPNQAQQRKASTIAAMFGVALVLGVLNVALNPDVVQNARVTGTQIAGNLVLLYLGFRWLAIDSAQLDIRRPLWLNVCIILLAIVFVPYYFYKTRRPGQRAQPILLFLALVVGIGIVSAIGSTLMLTLQSGAAPGTPGI